MARKTASLYPHKEELEVIGKQVLESRKEYFQSLEVPKVLIYIQMHIYLCILPEIKDQEMLMAVICFSPCSLFISEDLQGSITLN